MMVAPAVIASVRPIICLKRGLRSMESESGLLSRASMSCSRSAMPSQPHHCVDATRSSALPLSPGVSSPSRP